MPTIPSPLKIKPTPAALNLTAANFACAYVAHVFGSVLDANNPVYGLIGVLPLSKQTQRIWVFSSSMFILGLLSHVQFHDKNDKMLSNQRALRRRRGCM